MQAADAASHHQALDLRGPLNRVDQLAPSGTRPGRGTELERDDSEAIERRRKDPKFRARLRKIIDEDRVLPRATREVSVEYLDLADFIAIVAEVTGLDEDTIIKVADLGFADSARACATKQ